MTTDFKILVEAVYNDKTRSAVPEYEDVEDDIRSHKYNPNDYKPGGARHNAFQKTASAKSAINRFRKDSATKHYGSTTNGEKNDKPKNLGFAKRIVKGDHTPHVEIPQHHTSVPPSNDWEHKVVEARKEGKIWDTHANRVKANDSYVANTVAKMAPVKSKDVNLPHIDKNKLTRVHVFPNGIHVPVSKTGEYTHGAYQLRHPSETGVTPRKK